LRPISEGWSRVEVAPNRPEALSALLATEDTRIIGMTKSLALLLVVFVDRSARDAEVIHPISARRAVDYEKSIYEDQFL
jgi:uncharacterized DUF497 family protein